MVEQIAAFKAEDGRLFTSEQAALIHDAETRLKGCIGQVPTVEVMQKALAVHEILTPLVAYLRGESNA